MDVHTVNVHDRDVRWTLTSMNVEATSSLRVKEDTTEESALHLDLKE